MMLHVQIEFKLNSCFEAILFRNVSFVLRLRMCGRSKNTGFYSRGTLRWLSFDRIGHWVSGTDYDTLSEDDPR